MPSIEPLGLSSNRWRFLTAPDQYVEAGSGPGRVLVAECLRRQFLTARDILARLNGSDGEEARRGILLADDVGLGKTTVAALVAWVVASGGEKRRVRILAPNDVMRRRWVEELHSHVDPLRQCAPELDVRKVRVKSGKGRLSANSIQVINQYDVAKDVAKDRKLPCDLLIVDEAHRAKGTDGAFGKALRRRANQARRVLLLTATPFSIDLKELLRMLSLVGGDAARPPVSAFSRALDDLYCGNTSRSPEVVAERLATKATAAVAAIRPFVIRHGISDLPDERSAFGLPGSDWPISVPPARPDELELMLRMDRALRVVRDEGFRSPKATNDPRFHVGWRHFDKETDTLEGELPRLAEPARTLIETQLGAIRKLRADVGAHSKMKAVATEVTSIVDQRAAQNAEKVLLFCDHIATAQELTIHLNSVLTKPAPSPWPAEVWQDVWREALEPPDHEFHDNTLHDAFVEWLSADLIRAQTWSWLPPTTRRGTLGDALTETKARHHANPESIAEAARRLYLALLSSRSSRAILKRAGGGAGCLPAGGTDASRVLGVCEPSGDAREEALFIHHQQPDTIISIFNSPFGPDVLVVTDKLSEGIDLHRYCRHLIHYELDPSPVRTVQRNGRLRRVSSWAAATGQEIRYAYPAFPGTRDQRLVQIMRKRIGSFSLLLGGVQDFDVEEVVASEETWRNRVVELAKARLEKTSGLLRAIKRDGRL